MCNPKTPADFISRSIAGLREPETTNVEVHLHDSVIGVLNTGEISDVDTISVNVSALAKSDHSEIATALKELTEAVVASQELSTELRAHLLANFGELSKQARLAPENRLSREVIKTITTGVATTIQATAGLATVWTTWGSTILKFFGLG